MIRQKEISLARHSGCRFTHWFLAACLLAGSAIATTANAAPTILATNQGNVTNIIVDDSRVYWINVNNSAVSSVDKLNGGATFIHSPASTLYGSNIPANGGDIVQDSTNLYFISNTGGPAIGINSSYNVYRVPKTSSGATLLTPVPPPTDTDTDPAERNPGGPALGISTTLGTVNGNPVTTLLYFSGAQNLPPGIPGVPPNDGSIGTIEIILGNGTTVPQQYIPFTTEPNWEPNLFPNHFSSDSNTILFSNGAATNPDILGLVGDIGTGSWHVCF